MPFTSSLTEKEFSFYTKKQDSFWPIHIDDLQGLLDGLVNKDDFKIGANGYTQISSHHVKKQLYY